jgi:hypothetical protein
MSARSQTSTAADTELPIGAHLVTPRGGYRHHGIYVGHGRVVHYAGLVGLWRFGPVEEIALPHFASGHAIWIDDSHPSAFDAAETVERARSRLGERRYRIFTNNCEHFCTWCRTGTGQSEQVLQCARNPATAVRMFLALCVSMVVPRYRGRCAEPPRSARVRRLSTGTMSS